MTTVFIADLAVTLPARFAAGDKIDETAISILNDIVIKRLKARLRYALQRGEINADGIQQKALEILSQDLAPYSTDDEDADTDPVMLEAMSIARELITSRMAAEALPPPKGLDTHAKALVDAMPELLERARLRVEARLRLATAALEEMI